MQQNIDQCEMYPKPHLRRGAGLGLGLGLACGVVQAAGLAPPSIRASRPRRSLTPAWRSGSPRVRGAAKISGGGRVPGGEGARRVASRRLAVSTRCGAR